MKIKMNKKVVAYVRSSIESYKNLAGQEKEIVNFANNQHLNIVRFYREAKTGLTAPYDLCKAIEYAINHQCDLIVSEASRVSSNFSSFFNLISYLKNNNVRLLLANNSVRKQ